MAKEETKATEPVPAGADLTLRQRAALEILGAYVAKHGGFEKEAMKVHVAQVWLYADVFVQMENAPPPEPMPNEPVVLPPRGRKAHPTDEWGVRDNGKLRRGFMTREDAEYDAVARPGAQIVQLGGPEVNKAIVAEAN